MIVIGFIIGALVVLAAVTRPPQSTPQVIGRDIRVPRSLGVPTAYREAHPEVWCEREERL